MPTIMKQRVSHIRMYIYNCIMWHIHTYIQDYNILYLVNMEVNDCMVNVPLSMLPGLLLFLIINPTTMQMKIIHSPNTLPTTAGIITAIGAESVVELNVVLIAITLVLIVVTIELLIINKCTLVGVVKG